MTNKEALIAAVLVSVPDNTLEKALVDNNILGEEDYESDAKKDIEVCAIDVLRSALMLADITEGGYSIRYDRKAIQERIDSISEGLGLSTSAPTVQGVSPW